MHAARRWCLRAVGLVGTTSAVVSLALSACQFPDYSIVIGGSGAGGGTGMGGMSGVAGLADDGAGRGGDGGAGAGGEGADGGGGGGAPEPIPCPADACVARAPADWYGPVALWDSAGRPDAPPECPEGYDTPNDVHRGLVAPDGECQCTCTPEGQECLATVEIFTDMNCGGPCATASVSDECSPVSGCSGSQGSLRAESPEPSGGACVANVSRPPEPTWQANIRLCLPSKLAVCPNTNEVCAPTPEPPYTTERCIMRVVQEPQSTPECPPEFPMASPPLYAGVDDGRKCSECGCGSVSGGSCGGTLRVSPSGNCSGGVEYTLDDPCQAFDLGPGNVHPSRVMGEFTVVPGDCSVASPSMPTGVAVEKGPFTFVCCKG